MWPFKFPSLHITKTTTTEEELPTLVLDETEFEDKTLETLEYIKTILTRSYGPFGANTLIQSNNADAPIVTKDGFTILKNIPFHEAVGGNIHKLIIPIANNLVKTVGDGSTSAVLIAIELYKELLEIKNLFMFNNELIQIINTIGDIMISHIDNNYTYKLNVDNKFKTLNAIASISNNNDTKLGTKVASIFSQIDHLSTIKIELDREDKPVDVTYSIDYGFNFSGRPIHNMYFGTSPSITLEEPIIIAFYELFEDHFKIAVDLYEKNKRPIVIITDMIDSNTMNLALGKFMSKNQIYIIKTNSLASDVNRNEFIDLCVYTDTNICMNPKEFEEDFQGSCKSLTLTPSNSVFCVGNGIGYGTDIFNDRVNEIKEHLLQTPDNKPIIKGSLKVRLDKMNGVNVTLFVSGRTIEEKNTARFLVEDAVLACKSAIEYGFTLGSNMVSYYVIRDIHAALRIVHENNPSLSKYNFDLVNHVVVSILSSYYEMITFNIMNNFNVDNEIQANKIDNAINRLVTALPKNPLVMNQVTGCIESLKDTTVLAPVKTDKEIIKASFAMVTMLLSVNQYLV